MEPRLERSVRKEVGSPVDIAIHSSRTMGKGREKAGFFDALVATLGKSVRNDRIDAFAEFVIGSHFGSVLVVTPPAVFNHPRFQTKVLGHDYAAPVRFMVEPETGSKEWEGRLHEVLTQLLASCLRTTTEAKVDEARDIDARKRVHPPYLRASQPIRSERSGRIDAEKIRKFFGLTLRELAKILQLPNHQSIAKTPDAVRLEEKLHPFEEILHGRLLVNEDDVLFRQWLNTPNKEFPVYEDKRLSPMDFIRMGHPEVVANLVEDELTGHPA